MKFPLVCIKHNPEHDNEDLDWHEDEDSFTSVEPFYLKRNEPIGQLVVDAAGHAWRIAGVTDHGAKGTGWRKLLRIILQGSHRVSYDLEAQPPISFPELKERIAAAILSNPDHWRDDEAIAGEGGEPRDEQEMQEERIARVRRTRDMRQLVAVLMAEARCEPLVDLPPSSDSPR